MASRTWQASQRPVRSRKWHPGKTVYTRGSPGFMRAVVGLLILVLVAGTAIAAPKVALTEIDGDDSGDLREAVAEALDGKELSVIGAKETNRQVDKLKIELPDINEKQAKKLASELEADVVMAGTLGKEGKSKLLKFRVFINGKKVKGFSVQFSNARSKKFKDGVREKMVDKVAAAPAVVEDKPEPVAQVDEGDKKKKKKKKRPSKKRKADGEPDEGDKPTATAEEEDEQEEDEQDEHETAKLIKATTPQHAANRVAFRVDIGSSFSARSLTFTFTPELAADNLEPKPFKPGPVAGVRAEGELYPLAFANPEAVYAGLLGVGFEVDQVLSSKVQTTLEPGNVGVVKQFHFSVGPRIRFTLGNADIAPSVTVGLSYGRRQFVVTGGLDNREMTLDLPDTDYTYIAPALNFRIPLGIPNIAILSLNDLMLVKDAGRISDADQYGRAKVFGIDSQAGLDITIKRRFALRLMAEFTQIGFTFTGGGQKSRNRDGDATSIDIGGATDRSIGGVATLGVLY